ncbi:hypothetical protein SETIT_8G057100v2 [Setaria italica]|uniref:MINDY deubiquitinase domain-containing protein n=1 Tax=Setaria italica TaxID=4555 RepID=A0A368S4I5_SETIT|nr:hypothetical protein SETIT_8G057100v2 [Setaria italica]RCV37368.1 hypothetical protein SETIT_8G057100v2 [Setaria italica]
MADSKKKYRAREIEFLGQQRHIVLQDVGGWSPLVEVVNVLLLRDELPEGIIFQSKAHGEKYIEKYMMESVLDTCLVRRLQTRVKLGTLTRAQVDKHLPEFRKVIVSLSETFTIYPKFTRTNDFEDTPDKLMYNALGIAIYHGWLMNPQDTDTSEAVGIESSAKLIIEADELMKSESKGKTDRLSLLQSIWNNQFTSYGFAHLCNDVPEGVLCLLYRDERINVLYKHKGMLHVLVTAQDVLENYPDALWRKLEKVDEDGDLLTSSFGPINVTWRENERNLIEDERKAVKQKETRRLKNAKKRGRRKDKKNTVTQDESGEANKDLGDEEEANTAGDRGPASPKDGVLGPSQDNMLRDGFMKFLKEYLLDGKSYFRDQVELMHLKGTSHLIICYGWIKTYDKELAVSICSNYFRAAEDLKLCFCDYFHSIIQENSVDTDKVELYTKIKLTICCLPLRT